MAQTITASGKEECEPSTPTGPEPFAERHLQGSSSHGKTFRQRSLTEGSGFSCSDSDFGVSEQQLTEASSSRCIERKISFSPALERRDSDYGIADEQLEELERRAINNDDEAGELNDSKVPPLPLTGQGAQSGSIAQIPQIRNLRQGAMPPTMPSVVEESPRLETTRSPSLREGLLPPFDSGGGGGLSRSSSLARFESASFTAAARGPGSSGFERSHEGPRGLLCFARARQCVTGWLQRRGLMTS
eukprot:TRINITY_DN94322_c0_g1_i1.p1 TRINITY_DN94322_c0_g1~~TRINITY_DN94322_c0_g1_i1.p1  ORF type:complete len:264 (-),score=47.53 TRINITY_DN94322_c0_g1_i1:63-797(-)